MGEVLARGDKAPGQGAAESDSFDKLRQDTLCAFDSGQLKLDGTSKLPAAFTALDSLLGTDLCIPPSESKFGGREVPKDRGCATTLSNMLDILLPEFTAEHCEINVDDLENTLESNFQARALTASELPQKGDLVFARGNGRHVGFIRSVEGDNITVYHNLQGRVVCQSLTERFLSQKNPAYNYPTVYFLRVPALSKCAE